MHSGTNLLRYEILKEWDLQGRNKEHHYFRHLFLNQRVDDYDCTIAAHLVDHVMDKWIPAFEEFPIYTSMRHPARVWESFKRRGKSKESYDSQWRNMIDVVYKYDPFFVHIDRPDIRDSQVSEMARRLDKPLKTDWHVGKDTGSHKNTHNLEITEELLKEIPQEYIDFYYETADGRELSKAG
jgi:hypothetical protein